MCFLAKVVLASSKSLSSLASNCSFLEVLVVFFVIVACPLLVYLAEYLGVQEALL
jgi:hypothetical protein